MNGLLNSKRVDKASTRLPELQVALRRLRASVMLNGASVLFVEASRSKLYFPHPRAIGAPLMRKTITVPANTAGQNGAEGRRVAASDTPAATNPT